MSCFLQFKIGEELVLSKTPKFTIISSGICFGDNIRIIVHFTPMMWNDYNLLNTIIGSYIQVVDRIYKQWLEFTAGVDCTHVQLCSLPKEERLYSHYRTFH